MELGLFVFLLLDRSILNSTWSVSSGRMLCGRVQSFELMLPLEMQNLLIKFQACLRVLIQCFSMTLWVENFHILLFRKYDIVALNGFVLTYVVHIRLIIFLKLINRIISCTQSLRVLVAVNTRSVSTPRILRIERV